MQKGGGRNATDLVTISLRGEARGAGGYVTNWRRITLGDKPGDLPEKNYLLLNLNKPRGTMYTDDARGQQVVIVPFAGIGWGAFQIKGRSNNYHNQ